MRSSSCHLGRGSHLATGADLSHAELGRRGWSWGACRWDGRLRLMQTQGLAGSGEALELQLELGLLVPQVQSAVGWTGETVAVRMMEQVAPHAALDASDAPLERLQARIFIYLIIPTPEMFEAS